jgi:putative membrane protein
MQRPTISCNALPLPSAFLCPQAPRQLAAKAKLDSLSGDAFDKSYIRGQIRAHRDAVTLFRNEIATGQDPEANEFARSTLPTLRSHLKAIRAIAKDAGISAK